MTNTPDDNFEPGREIWEMTQTAGWQILCQQIQQEIELETNELLDCPLSEDVEHKQMIKAYKKVLSMVESSLHKRNEDTQVNTKI